MMGAGSISLSVEMFLPMFIFLSKTTPGPFLVLSDLTGPIFQTIPNVHTQVVERIWGQQNGVIGSIVDASWGPRHFLLRHFAAPTFTFGIVWKTGPVKLESTKNGPGVVFDKKKIEHG